MRFPLAALLLLIAPVANAQDACEPYRKVVDAMATGFESLKGKEKPDSRGSFVATLVLDGDECEVWDHSDYSMPSYRCKRTFAVEADARAAASERLARAKSCFPG